VEAEEGGGIEPPESAMTDKPSSGAAVPRSRSDGYEERPSLPNQRSQQEPRFQGGSQDHQESGQQPPECKMSARPPSATTGAPEIAFAALRHLPTPLLVLSDLKTVVFANRAMEQILGFDTNGVNNSVSANECDAETTATDFVQGKSLTQLGIQIVQEEQQRWVGWEV
jgi:hypothetical protein